MMYSDEEFEKLEEEQHQSTVDDFAAILALLSSSFNILEKDLSVFYQKYGDGGVLTYTESRKKASKTDKRKKIAIIYLILDSMLDSLYKGLESEFRIHLTSIIQSEIDFFDVDIDVDDVLTAKWGSDNLTWNDRLWNNRDKWDDLLCKDLKLALIKKESISDLLKTYHDELTSMGKSVSVLFNTESSAIQSIARNQIFKKLGIKKYRFYTRADERTCEKCGSMHGLVFPISSFEINVTASPLHPRCRCWEVPID